jgi:SAM-dependent methyltransferase
MVAVRCRLAACALVAGAVAGTALAQSALMTYEDARPVLERVSAGVPSELRDLRGADAASRFAAWAGRRDREIRARVSGGDDDSLVNLWLYGTSFTSLPRAVAGDGVDVDALARGRLDAFLEAVAGRGDNERLTFARSALAARGFDLSTPGGRRRAADHLTAARRRMQAEFAATAKTLAAAASEPGGGATAAAFATIFSGRGLSSDTSILPARGVSAALEAIRGQGLLRPGGVRRVAVVGPGLDFTNKADGYDFYPQQTIQPFAAIDTLRRLGLAGTGLTVTTFDLSARVNQHLAAARARAAQGNGYVITLPIEGGSGWNAPLLAYWQEFGAATGEEVPAPPAPAAAGAVRARAVRMAPAVVSAIVPRDLNIVLQRPALPEDERFDLVIATNVLVYYDVFEQALAAANIGSMLRPGGVFLTNTAVFPPPPLKPSAQYLKVAYTDTEYDEFFWYERN